MSSMPFSPAAERNRAPILAVLQRLLPREAMVLEVAAGTGQHAAHFAAAEPGWRWQPTDADDAALAGIAAHATGLPNVRPPLRLDVLAGGPWPGAAASFDAVYCANMLHIAPWATCAALMRGAAGRLKPGGRLVIYGPFLVDGEPPAPSNLAFDADLRRRDPAWGLRSLAAVQAEAAAAGLAFDQRIDMPANNLVLAFQA
jgi:SAM-dependent methyltransferase